MSLGKNHGKLKVFSGWLSSMVAMSLRYAKAGNSSLMRQTAPPAHGSRQGACAAQNEPCPAQNEPIRSEGPFVSFGTSCEYFKPPRSIQAEKNNLSLRVSTSGRFFSLVEKIVRTLDPAPQLLPRRFAARSHSKREE